MVEEQVKDIIEQLSDLLEDNTVPRNVKSKIQTIINYLNENADLSLKVNKALNILDEISDDNNIQAYTRTQIWNFVSMLEALG